MTFEEVTPYRAGQCSADRIRDQAMDWNAVYAEQLPRIYNYFRFRVRHQADIEELTSRTFEKAWRAREQYRRDLAGFSTWLFSIARNVATDHLRSARPHVSIDTALDIPTEHTAEDEVAHDSDIERLVALTSCLPEREAELLALKYGAELNNRAIARLTGLSESNVGTLLHRTVTTLRSKW